MPATDENCIEAGTKLKDLSQYFQATAAGDSNDQATAAFYNGEAAMLVQGSWAIAQINGNNPDFESKCGVFQFPGIDGANDPNRMIVKTDNLLMSSTTEHQDAAIALMKMFTDETAQKYTAEVGGKFPIIKDLDIDYDKAPAQLKYVQDIMAKATGTFGFYNESLASVEAGDSTMSPAGTAWCLSMIAGYLCDRQGVDLAAIADHTANWTDENCIEAGTKLKDLSQYFQATAAGDSNDQATAAFYNGEAMLVQGSWAIAQINGNNQTSSPNVVSSSSLESTVPMRTYDC